jgi:hypothetical protein
MGVKATVSKIPIGEITPLNSQVQNETEMTATKEAANPCTKA